MVLIKQIDCMTGAALELEDDEELDDEELDRLEEEELDEEELKEDELDDELEDDELLEEDELLEDDEKAVIVAENSIHGFIVFRLVSVSSSGASEA